MLSRILGLIRKYREALTYLFFGGLTTVVNYLVYLPCYHMLRSGAVSNVIAWVFAVAFAFLTNKPFVFRSHDWSRKVVVPELTKFLSCRIGSGLAETVIIFLAVDLLQMNATVWKLITSVMVVVLNYFGSKLLVFRRKREH